MFLNSASTEAAPELCLCWAGRGRKVPVAIQAPAPPAELIFCLDPGDWVPHPDVSLSTAVPVAPKDEGGFHIPLVVTYVCPFPAGRRGGHGGHQQAGGSWRPSVRPALGEERARPAPPSLHPAHLLGASGEGIWLQHFSLISVLPPPSANLLNTMCSGPRCFHLWLITFLPCICFLRLQNEIDKSHCRGERLFRSRAAEGTIARGLHPPAQRGQSEAMTHVVPNDSSGQWAIVLTCSLPQCLTAHLPACITDSSRNRPRTGCVRACVCGVVWRSVRCVGRHWAWRVPPVEEAYTVENPRLNVPFLRFLGKGLGLSS